MTNNNWFTVSKTGLEKVQAEKEKFFVVQELISNSFDEDIKLCKVNLEKINGTRTYQLTVYDDSPVGFKDLTHAYTLFAESSKKGNVKQRGRFNLGEKLALAMFKSAEIKSTKGTIIFNEKGRSKSKHCSEVGTSFTGKIVMTHDEYNTILNQVKSIIVPDGVDLKVNGIKVAKPNIIKSFETSLPTIISDEDGNLKKSYRKTIVEIYPKSNDKGKIFELGIPVVEFDIDYNVNVLQKIPLNKDRDNITPAYRKQLATEVLNHCFDNLSEEQTSTGWVTDALENANIDAVYNVLSKKHGSNAVVHDPTDKEANGKAFADDREVIGGGSYNSYVWNQIRQVQKETGSFKRAGAYPAFAKPKFKGGAIELPLKDYTSGMSEVAIYTNKIHKELFGIECKISLHNGNGASATYNKAYHKISFFWEVLGRDWFNLSNNKEQIDRLLIHEFGHYYSSNHLSESYYDGLCKIGAKWIALISQGKI
mgnify:FL=1|tara:strand:+ start:449 stop:1885 length:1437 start_codon:yes stop_codon:yes gene_type:complete